MLVEDNDLLGLETDERGPLIPVRLGHLPAEPGVGGEHVVG